MFDFLLRHPYFLSVPFLFFVVYFFKLALSSREKRIHNLNREIYLREKKIQRLLDVFQSQTGVKIDTLMKLESVEDSFHSLEESEKVQKYISRLFQLNEEKREAFKVRPILAHAGVKIADKELFSKSKEEFLIREKALCNQVAKDMGIVCLLSTNKTECKIVKVIDGDTFDVQVGSNRIRIRAMGYDTPEVCHPKKSFGHWGIQATESAEKIVNNGKVFHVYLDATSHETGWTNDRYGRTLAHIEVDGVLIGKTLIENGDASVVDVFPIDKKILFSYQKSEYDAKTNDLGMWLDINRYKLERKKTHEQKKWNLLSIIENQKEINMNKALMSDILNSMIGKVLSRSKNSMVLHNEDCRYMKSISESISIELTNDMLDSGSIRPCKVCNGDDLVKELMN